MSLNFVNSFVISTCKLWNHFARFKECRISESYYGYFPDSFDIKTSAANNDEFILHLDELGSKFSNQNFIQINKYDLTVVGSYMNTQAMYYLHLPERNIFIFFNDLVLAKNVLQTINVEVEYRAETNNPNLNFFNNIHRLLYSEKLLVSFQDGKLTVDKERFSDILLQDEKEYSFEDAKHNFYNVLFDRTKQLTEGIDNLCISLSGGIDSGTIAYILKELGKNIYAFTLSTDWGNEYKEAKETADFLGIKLEKIEVQSKEIVVEFSNVIRYFTFIDHTPIEIALVAHSIYRKIRNILGKNIIFCSGYGSDLLNAGLYTPFTEYNELKLEIKSGLRKTQFSNEFSNLAAYDMGIKPLHPFWDSEVIQEALKIPARYKVVNNQDKYFFRSKMEEKFPHSIAWRTKKGAHLGTGIGYHLRNLLESTYRQNNNNISFQEIIKEIHRNIFLHGKKYNI